jgi:hypothetical protein
MDPEDSTPVCAAAAARALVGLFEPHLAARAGGRIGITDLERGPQAWRLQPTR